MSLLDFQFNKDLTELYKGLNMSDVVNLSTKSVVKGTSFSTRSIPLHFCGNHEADTVFVMLNLGENACMADAMFLAKTASYQSFKAIIACSFPNHALATANSLMEQYGEFCFKNY